MSVNVNFHGDFSRSLKGEEALVESHRPILIGIGS